MPCIKFLDLQCRECKDGILHIDLTKLPQNFNCWQGVLCPSCKSYNHFRMRKVPFFNNEIPPTSTMDCESK